MTLGEFLKRFEYMNHNQQIRFHSDPNYDMDAILSVYESPDTVFIEVDLGYQQ